MDHRIVVACLASAVAALVPVAASTAAEPYMPALWDDVAYDRPLSEKRPRALGWRCYAFTRPDAEGQDGQCGPRVDPGITVFGVPAAAASVFLKGGSLHVVNIQVHATSAPFVADNLCRLFGSPQKSTWEDGSCVLLWDRVDRSYRLFLTGSDDLARYATLFVSPRRGVFAPLDASSPSGAVKALASRSPCARF